ncbi:hypothetical protein NXY02_23950 (plasmid) [Bacteroides fragilis]|nr:hypothetical protein [Bacteroides fragilis]
MTDKVTIQPKSKPEKTTISISGETSERLEKMKAEWNRDLQEPHQEQGREESQQQGNSISQVPEINQVPQRKKQQEEENDRLRNEIKVLQEYKEKAHRELCRVRDEQKTFGKIKVKTEFNL